MKNRLKIILACLIGIAFGVAATVILQPVIKEVVVFCGPPHVTLLNLTGEEISGVTISLGSAKRPVSNLKDGQAITVSVVGHFIESSTIISWTDSAGKHTESADDYVENYGFYHATVALTPGRKAKSISELKNLNQDIRAVDLQQTFPETLSDEGYK